MDRTCSIIATCGWISLSLGLHLLLLMIPNSDQPPQGKRVSYVQIGLVPAPALTAPTGKSTPAPTPAPNKSTPRATPERPPSPSPQPKQRHPQAVPSKTPPPTQSPRQTSPATTKPAPVPVQEAHTLASLPPQATKSVPSKAPEKASQHATAAAGTAPGSPARQKPLTLAVPRYDVSPQPRYPRLAQKRGWEGETLLRVQVGIHGESLEVELEKSSGHKILDDSAIEAVRKWRFQPGRRGLLPVETEVLVPVRFALRSP